MNKDIVYPHDQSVLRPTVLLWKISSFVVAHKAHFKFVVFSKFFCVFSLQLSEVCASLVCIIFMLVFCLVAVLNFLYSPSYQFVCHFNLCVQAEGLPV